MPKNIDDFHYACTEILCALYSVFPVRYLLLVEDITGPIKWDMTGLPDRKSRACFETMIWLADHGVLDYRTAEPKDIGVEGAVLSQQAFVLLVGNISWDTGENQSRIEALLTARRNRAYGDVGTIINDVLSANCRWSAPSQEGMLPKTPTLSSDESD